MIQQKDTYSRVAEPNTFSKNRKKFKAYEAQYRLYIWANQKRGDWRNIKTVTDQILYITSKLRGKAFARLEPYIS
jgi:hypothetical protein